MSSIFSAIQWPFGIAVGTGVGAAAAGAIAPGVQEVVNEAWSTHPVRPPAAGLLAAGVAQGQITDAQARQWAHQTGFGDAQFDAMIRTADTGPGVPRAFELWRRGAINEAAFRRACKRQALEDEWTNGLVALHDVLLSPSELANARQQEFIDDARLHEEGARQGYTAERMDLLYKMAGLPPGPMDALQMLRRGILSEAEYRQLVAEGHTKTKYTDALLELRDHILTQHDAANLWLRGWITEAEAKAIGAQNGYDGAAMDLLYKNRGRPATVRQAHIGFARGGRLPGAGDSEEETIRRSVEESNIRTEWFDILYAQRFTYPSAFVLRALTTDGTFTEAETRQILVESGWKPEWADAAAAKWSGGGAGPSAKWADRARGRLYTSTHDEYLEFSIDEAQARSNLTRIGATAPEVDTVITMWNLERATDRRRFTATQVRTVWKKGNMTEAEALSYLDALGYSAEDARDFLAS